MTFTRSQLHERISDLSGQYRAAQENKRLTSEKRIEQDRLSELARQADEKADEQLARVASEIRDATAQYAAAAEEIVTGVGSADSALEQDLHVVQRPDDLSHLWCEEHQVHHILASCPSRATNAPAYNSIFTEGADFHSQALQNGADRVTEAFNEATR